jgi:hypothetical protein
MVDRMSLAGSNALSAVTVPVKKPLPRTHERLRQKAENPLS